MTGNDLARAVKAADVHQFVVHSFARLDSAMQRPLVRLELFTRFRPVGHITAKLSTVTTLYAAPQLAGSMVDLCDGA